jgi:hypothetical protein
MKKRILTAIAALLLVCFCLAPTVLKNTGLAWINWDALAGQRGFYFKKDQWLADLRTIVAAFRYLTWSYTGSPSNSLHIVNLPPVLPLQTEISTNLPGTNVTQSSLPLSAKRLARVHWIMDRSRGSSLSPLLAIPACCQLSSMADSEDDPPVWV